MAKEKTSEQIETAADQIEVKTAPEKRANSMRQYETVSLPRATGKEEDFVFVGLNGKGYTIKKGLPVRVPKPVAAILHERERQLNRLQDYQNRMIEKAQRGSADLGV